ncbi:proline-rich protein 22 [Athene cunicularia]|uniref:proline-rich protein 22 n=1 Tax=Athene cunicularia TaxID=194338 RepID=UPI000EF6A6C8|nr:proline-rich protein 22 [Athene cunicularia]
MELPPGWSLVRGSCNPHGPWFLRLTQLPQIFSTQGPANLCPLPGQEQPFPAAWTPPAGGAPHVPQDPPAGMLMAPCGCCFDPRVYGYEWTSTPPPPTSIPDCGNIEGLSAPVNTAGTDTTAGTPLGTGIAPGSNVPPSPAADPYSHGPGDVMDDLAVTEEMLQQEALRLLGCSLDTVGVSQNGPSSSLTPGNPGHTGAAVPPCDSPSLELPDKLLSLDCGILDTIDSVLGLEDFLLGLEAQEPSGDVGMEPPPSQPAVPEKRGRKRRQSDLAAPPSKRRELGDRPGGPEGKRDLCGEPGSGRRGRAPQPGPSTGRGAGGKRPQLPRLIQPVPGNSRGHVMESSRFKVKSAPAHWF